jgi:D-sedoheptulose 7-phosphate isomerase
MNVILERALGALRESASSAVLTAQLEDIAGRVRRALGEGKKILLCGNGGSAAEAQHIAAEFVCRFKKERKSLPAMALTTDTSILTAVANDYSYDLVFARQVEGLGGPGDILFILSTSGNSKSCLAAARAAKEHGLSTVGFTGAGGGALKGLVDLCFCVPSQVTSHIQEVHLVALHAVCEMVDESFPSK